MKSDLLNIEYFKRVYERNEDPSASYHVILGILIYAVYEDDINAEEFFKLGNINAEMRWQK